MDNVTRRELVATASVVGLTAITGTAQAAQDKPAERKTAEGSEFIVKFNGIKLPDDVEKRIAGEIQGSVMRALAAVDTAQGLTLNTPLKWRGYWIDKLSGTLPNVRAEIGR